MKHANIALFVPHWGCPHQCSFCNQRSITGQKQQITAQEVRSALQVAEQSLGEGIARAELAFFGGSFTAIPREEMVALLDAAQPWLRAGKLGGIRISTRPDAIDPQVLDILKEKGVTSIELGAQSMSDEVLQKNHRGHTARQVEEASSSIRRYGFALGLQMMTGLYGDTPEESLRTAERLAACQPDTMRIYPTIVMKHTPLEDLLRRGMYQPMGLEETVALCARLLDFFEEKKIPVIRLGLHDGADLERDYVAGPWHPAFRELCEGRRYLQKAMALLEGIPSGEAVVLRVHPSSVSQMIGQKKTNLLVLRQKGFAVTVRADGEVSPGQVALGEK